MKKMFNYVKFNNENHDALVESFSALSNAVIEGKQNTPEYQEANRQFNEDFMKECVSAIPNSQFNSMEDMKNPMINNDMCAKRF